MNPESLAGMITPASKEKAGKIPNPLRLKLRDDFIADKQLDPEAKILEEQVALMINAHSEADATLYTGVTHVNNIIRPFSFVHTEHYGKVRWFSVGHKKDSIHALHHMSREEKALFAYDEKQATTLTQARELPHVKAHEPVYVMLSGREGVFLWQKGEPFAILAKKPDEKKNYLEKGILGDASLLHRRLNHRSLELDVGLDNYGPQFRFWCPMFTSFHNTLVDHPKGARRANIMWHAGPEDPAIYSQCTPPLVDALETNYRFMGFIPDAAEKFRRHMQLALTIGFVGMEERPDHMIIPKEHEYLKVPRKTTH